MTVLIECFGPGQPLCSNETAVKGEVLSQTSKTYMIDASEYAKKQKYVGDWSIKLVDKDLCVPEKK